MVTTEKQLSAIALFKAYIGKRSKTVDKEALKYGVLIPSTLDRDVIDFAIDLYGKNGSLLNQGFHKSFEVVEQSSMEELLIQQIVHYITTYGFESVGCYSRDTVYIPKEELNVPELDTDKISLVVIENITEDEIKDKVLSLLTSGIALSEKTIKYLKPLLEYISVDDIDQVKNKEVRILLYELFNIVPKDPEEFLRFLLYELTRTTLKIQNKKTFDLLKLSSPATAVELINKYNNLDKLSSIFLRNKMLFLGLKKNSEYIDYCKRLHKSEKEINEIKKASSEINTLINKLKKLSKKNHKPVKQPLLNTLTYNSNYTNKELLSELDKTNMYQCVKIANALNYKLSGSTDHVYRVRNGTAFAKKTESENIDIAKLKEARELVENKIIENLKTKVSGKTVYIPENLVYKAPSTEKQFEENIPSGSYVDLPAESNDLIVAIHWYNLPDDRVDLDFHLVGENESYGWCYGYKSNNNDVVFSGDVVDPDPELGAVEAYLIKKGHKDLFNMNINRFTWSKENIPFDLIIARRSPDVPDDLDLKDASSRMHLIDPNNVIAIFHHEINSDKSQKCIGAISCEDSRIRVFLTSYDTGNVAVSTSNDSAKIAIEYNRVYNETQLTINDLLLKAGAIIVTNKEDIDNEVDYDLSLEAITKETIIDLFR